MPVLNDDTPSRTIQSRRKHAAGRRARILNEGGRRIDLLLEHDVGADLATLEEGGEDATTVISALIRKAAAAKRRKR